MSAFSHRRSVVAVAVLCAGLGAGLAVAVQAGAASSPTPKDPPRTLRPDPRPPVGAVLPNGKLAPQVLATNVHCGQTITASITMNGDLACSTSGLTVAGTNVILNLGGHVVAGPASSSSTVGITVTGSTDTVKGGKVNYFGYGIQLSGAKATVTAINASYNRIGIADFGSASKVTSNVLLANVNYGAYGVASGSTYSLNHALNNGNGLYIVGGSAIISSNITNGNEGYGLFEQGVESTLTKNVANFNGTDGIYVNETNPTDGGGNTAKGNDYVSGALAEQCYGVVCS